MDARETALDMIVEIMEKGRYSHIVTRHMLDRDSSLSRQDKAFALRLCLGVVENSMLLDYEINKYSKIKTEKQKPFIRNLLRMGAYQLGFMTVPESAACNESVKLAKKRGFSGLAGFVNAVLRNIARNLENFGNITETEDEYTKLSIKYSFPKWLISHLDKNIEFSKASLEETLIALNKEKPVSLRINKSLASKAMVLESLNRDNVIYSSNKDTVFEDCVILKEFDSLSDITAFKNGWLQVQDKSSMLVCLLAGIKPDSYIIDVCAAPGGKSIHAADILMSLDKERHGFVSSRDISEKKLLLIDENIKRSGFCNIKTKVSDALLVSSEDIKKADIVIADLPCSGIGIIGRKPDIKYKLKQTQLKELAELQRNILNIAAGYVKPGGILMYSTCTIDFYENEENYKYILENLGFKSVSIEEELPDILKDRTGKKGYIQIFPTDGGLDGFFVSKAIKL